MADNVPITSGSGTDIAADDISSVWYQRVKLSLGADGSATDALGGAGAVAAGVQRTTLASDDPAVTALQVIDDWDESDRAKVNIIVGQAGVAAGAGAVGVTVPRVTLASDDPGVASLSVIDDWDESDRAKVNVIVGQAGIAAGAGAVGATVPRVTLASDDPGVAHLANIVTAVQIMDDWDESDRAKVNPIVGQAGVAAGSGAVGATTQRVILATDDPAVTSLAVLDDWDESDRAKVNLIVGQAGIAGGTGVDGNTVPRVSLATNVALPAGENHVGEVAVNLITVSTNFSRPADNNAYAAGDLIANSVTAGSVTPLSWSTAARVSAGAFMVRSVKLQKSDVTLTNASFRLHLFGASPTVTTTGDNGVFASVVSGASDWLGSLDVGTTIALADDAVGRGQPTAGGEIIVKLSSGQTLYGLLEARAAYGGAAANGETFTVYLELIRA